MELKKCQIISCSIVSDISFHSSTRLVSLNEASYAFRSITFRAKIYNRLVPSVRNNSRTELLNHCIAFWHWWLYFVTFKLIITEWVCSSLIGLTAIYMTLKWSILLNALIVVSRLVAKIDAYYLRSSTFWNRFISTFVFIIIWIHQIWIMFLPFKSNRLLHTMLLISINSFHLYIMWN